MFICLQILCRKLSILIFLRRVCWLRRKFLWRMMQSDCSLKEACNTYQLLANLSLQNINLLLSCVNWTDHSLLWLWSLPSLRGRWKIWLCCQCLFTAWEPLLFNAASEHLHGGQFAVVDKTWKRKNVCPQA